MASLKDFLKRPVLRVLSALGRRIGSRFDRPALQAPPRRVLVIQLGGIGDVLRTFPMIEAMQAAHASAEVSLLTNQGAGVLDFYAGLRPIRHIQFDLGRGYVSKLVQLLRLRQERIDLVLNPTRGDGMLECSMMAWLAGAPHRIGFDRDGAGFLNTRKRPFVDDVSILRQNLELLDPLGAREEPARLRIAIPDAAKRFAADWYEEHVPLGRLRIVIHPWAVSHSEFRAWRFAGYAELIDRLLRERDAHVLIVGGRDEARADRDSLAQLVTGGRVHDLSGGTGLQQAAALIAGCDLFVGNDSGLLHFALAAAVPTVAIFGATPAVQVLHTNANVTAVVAGVPCQPCYRHQPLFAYRCGHAFRCLQTLSAERVAAAALRQLAAGTGPVAAGSAAPLPAVRA